MSLVDVAVIVLTKNEEANLPHALKSVCGWAKEVFVFDSFSTDCTEAIARECGAKFVQHCFEDYSKQRNAALDLLPITAAWTMFLDADERLDDALKREVAAAIGADAVDGYYVRFKLYWRGTWVRRGYFGTWLMRLFRTGKARTDDRGVNEHQVVNGSTAYLQNSIVHEDHKGIALWLEKHVQYARREATRVEREERPTIAALQGTQSERKNWIRFHLWQRMPPALRATGLFGKRMLIDLAFLDGPAAVEYHFLQALWFQLVVGAFEAENAQRALESDDSNA
jgi:glycosyltransferase involved in cell wall biosynthesis